MSKVRINLPTYNEAENITQIIEEIFKFVPDIEIMVVDDNSPDGTVEIVAGLLTRYPNLSLCRRPGKQGLGRAYVDAFRQTLKDDGVTHVMMMDADFSHQPKYLPEMMKFIDRYDVVIGSRYIRGGTTEGWEWWRKILSKFGNLYCRLITGLPINDCTGGFNIIKVSALKEVNLDHIDMSGYAFIMELKYTLFRSGATFYEFPIVFSNRRGGESKLSNHIIGEGVLAPWKMVWRHLKK
jgi:dolichol-phosphate mannosyltransferase